MAYNQTSTKLGMPQVPVQITVSDWQKFLGRDPASAGTVPMMYAGQTIEACDPIFGFAEFVLAFGVASLAIGNAVVIGPNYATTRTVAGSRGRIGISMAANTDTAALSWFCVRGQAPATVAAATASGAPLNMTATAGALDDAVVAGDGLSGATSASAQGATVTTKVSNTVNGSPIITVPNIDGLYVGMAVTGTGIPGSTVISAIGYGGLMLGYQGVRALEVQLSNNATATGNPTLTFAHTATFITAMLNYPHANGAL